MGLCGSTENAPPPVADDELTDVSTAEQKEQKKASGEEAEAMRAYAAELAKHNVDGATAKTILEAKLAEKGMVSDDLMLKHECEKAFKAAAEVAASMGEEVGFVAWDHEKHEVGCGSTPKCNAFFIKTARGKCVSLSEHKDYSKMYSSPLKLMPALAAFASGASKGMSVMGAVMVKYVYPHDAKNEVTGYFSVSGCMDAHNDLKIAREALLKLGMKEDADGIFHAPSPEEVRKQYAEFLAKQGAEDEATAKAILEAKAAEAAMVSDQNMLKKGTVDVFKAAAEVAASMGEEVGFVAWDHEKHEVSCDKTPKCIAFFVKTARGKAAALSEHNDYSKMTSSALRIVPMLGSMAAGTRTKFPVMGCVMVKYTFPPASDNQVMGYFSVSGCMDAHNDLKIAREALLKVGMTEGADGIFTHPGWGEAGGEAKTAPLCTLTDGTTYVAPYFKVNKWDEFKAQWKPAYDDFAHKEDCVHYAFCFTDTHAHCREAYTSGEKVLQHLADVDSPLKAVLADGIAELERLDASGPAAEIAKLKEALTPLGCNFYTAEWGFRTALPAQEVDTGVHLYPFFEIAKGKAADFKKIWGDAYAATQAAAAEEKSLQYAFCFMEQEDGTTMAQCREAYGDAAGVLTHLGNVDAPLKAVLADGISTLKRLEVHGPAAELEKLKEALSPLGALFFATAWGFRAAVGDAPAPAAAAAGENPAMSTVMALFDACETGKGWDACKGFCADGATFASQSGPCATIPTIEAYTGFMQGICAAMPDCKYTIISAGFDAERSTAAVSAVFDGTHTATPEGAPMPPPTNKATKSDYAYVFTVDGAGKVSAMTKVWNSDWAMRQMGWMEGDNPAVAGAK